MTRVEEKGKSKKIGGLKWLYGEPFLALAICVAFETYSFFAFSRKVDEVTKGRKVAGLQPGSFGRQRDLNDAQYHAWRDNLPIYLLSAVGFLALSYLVKTLKSNDKEKVAIRAVSYTHLTLPTIYSV
eukprot:TRINITY_DN22257_c0_g1_i1.p1 TRINITY_DN22257_c0_g1~~TRINITY_DN22257_c0_g1_i1.p1  ORF type:complete len:127 (+),score=28.31 TRINITY_DN22257_c0_g1_i1:53-433(+)